MNKSYFKIINFISLLLFLLVIFIYYQQFDNFQQKLLFNNKRYLIEKELIINNTNQEIKNTYEIEINDELSIDQTITILNDYQYARNFLTKEEKELYDIILEKSFYHINSFPVKPINETSMPKVFTAVLNDNPEHFWLNNLKYYVSKTNKKVIKIDLIYNDDKHTRIQKQNQIDSITNSLIIELNKLASDYDKAKYIYDYIANNTLYDLKVINNQNIYSVLVDHHGVCAGYAKSFQYIMNKIGLQTLYITGKIPSRSENNIGHAWNMIQIDNNYYHVDVTWGNASFNLENGETNYYNNYHYFNIKDEDIFKTHQPELFYPLPKADNIKESYYYKENLLFNIYNHQINIRILEEIIKLNKQKNHLLTFKFTNEEAYQKAFAELLTNRGVFNLIRQANKQVINKINDNNIRYYKADNHLIIDIILNYK